jgi:hypothetical protein
MIVSDTAVLDLGVSLPLSRRWSDGLNLRFLMYIHLYMNLLILNVTHVPGSFH